MTFCGRNPVRVAEFNSELRRQVFEYCTECSHKLQRAARAVREVDTLRLSRTIWDTLSDSERESSQVNEEYECPEGSSIRSALHSSLQGFQIEASEEPKSWDRLLCHLDGAWSGMVKNSDCGLRSRNLPDFPPR